MSEIIEFIIEFILEIIFEGSSEIIGNKKISKWVRYPLIAIVVLVGLGIIGFFIYLSLTIMEDSLTGGLIILGISLLLLGCMIHKCIKMYKNIKKELASKKENTTPSSTDDSSNLTPSDDFFYYNDRQRF